MTTCLVCRQRQCSELVDFGRQPIQTIQKRIQPPLAEHLLRKYGAPDLIVARHVLEHAHDPIGFMETLRRFVKPTGYVIFEVPDCDQPFDLLDYTVLWEDHVLYLGNESLGACLRTGGFSVLRVDSYPAPYETAVVAIAQPLPPRRSSPDTRHSTPELV